MTSPSSPGIFSVVCAAARRGVFSVAMMSAAMLAVVFAASPADAQSRDVIRIVGSSTVFPFTTVVAERFASGTGAVTPIVESTGTGGGMKLFCAGGESPPLTNASRRIKSSEFQTCADNGVTVSEIPIGFDGIVFANAVDGPDFELTSGQIFQALAAQVPVNGVLTDNPYDNWSDIDSSLPDLSIQVLGPPPTSGTRDALLELAMEDGANTFDYMKALRESDREGFIVITHTLREDGAYIDAGENDNLLVRKLEVNPDTIGILGFGFLDNNRDRIKGIPIDGVIPDVDLIADGTYSVARPLFLYANVEQADANPVVRDFLREYTAENTWGDEGYLADKGLIPLYPPRYRQGAAKKAADLTPLTSREMDPGQDHRH